MTPRIISLVGAALAVLTLVSACANTSAGNDRPVDTLTVFAAASLAEPFQDIADAFETDHPGLEVAFNFAGSQTLRTQLEHGAAADVFASADGQQMAGVREADLLRNTPEYFAANRLTVVAPVESAVVQTLSDLAVPGVSIAIASAEVPAGAYARHALELMAASVEYPASYGMAVLDNVVTNETSVRGVAQKVALGEVDAGLIYETDAGAAQYAGAFRVIPIPSEYNPAAEYPIAALAASARPEAALAFIAFVQGDAGQAVLREHGFAPPTGIACPCAGARLRRRAGWS